MMALHYNPHRNTFRVFFLGAMLVKGLTYGFLGIRATVEQNPIQPWEQVNGHLLWVSCVFILIGLFWNGQDTRDGILSCRIGYIGFTAAEAIFACGAFASGFWIGVIPFLMNGLIAIGSLASAIEVDRVVRWRMEHQ